MTPEERERLHEVLFSRALREITDGDMKQAQIAVDVMEKVGTGEDTASQVLAALLGDNGISDGT